VRYSVIALLLVAGSVAAEESQAVLALRHLQPRSAAGPTAWTAGPYQYDGAGNILTIGSESFVYDKLGRLKSATVRGPDLSSLQTQTLNYDEYGNLTGTSKLGQSVGFPADASTNRLTTVGYGAEGNVISAGAWQFDYDAAGMLNAVRQGSQPQVIYAYTADDQRLFSFDVTTGTTHWTLRGFDTKVLRDFRQQGSHWSVERDYAYRNGLPLAAFKSAGAVEHYSLDHLGTPRLITDGAGHRIGSHAYWPFGEEWSPATAQEGSPLKFTGHERDPDRSGLDYMHARYYAPVWGRFLAVDPALDQGEALSLPQKWNRYTYADNNPILKVDPDGRQAVVATPGSGPAAPLSVALYHIVQMQTNPAYREAAVSFVTRNVALANLTTRAFFGMVSQTTPLPLLMGKRHEKSGAVPGDKVDPDRARQLGERAKQESVADVIDQLASIQDRQRRIRQGKASGVIDTTDKSEQRADHAVDRIRNLADALADALEGMAEDETGPEPGNDQKPPENFE
jgi:RHS repeat-associated protein